MINPIKKYFRLYPENEVRAVDILSELGHKANAAIPKYDYAHPNAAGMDKIASMIYRDLGEWIDPE